MVSSSGSGTDGDIVSDDEDDRKSYEIEQNDFEFAPGYTYMSNVSCIRLVFINFV